VVSNSFTENAFYAGSVLISGYVPIRVEVGYAYSITDVLGLFLFLDMHIIQLTTIVCIPEFTVKLQTTVPTKKPSS
jgi:hypothetical protein